MEKKNITIFGYARKLCEHKISTVIATFAQRTNIGLVPMNIVCTEILLEEISHRPMSFLSFFFLVVSLFFTVGVQRAKPVRYDDERYAFCSSRVVVHCCA